MEKPEVTGILRDRFQVTLQGLTPKWSLLGLFLVRHEGSYELLEEMAPGGAWKDVVKLEAVSQL